MYYLSTVRHLRTPATDDTVARLLRLLTDEIAPSAATVEGLQSISWMLSQDGLTLQAYSGWQSADDLPRAENSVQHTNNGKVINELLGGLASPQEHAYYRLLAEHTVR